MGHRDLLVTQTYLSSKAITAPFVPREASAAGWLRSNAVHVHVESARNHFSANATYRELKPDACLIVASGTLFDDERHLPVNEALWRQLTHTPQVAAAQRRTIRPALSDGQSISDALELLSDLRQIS
jgi:hypothetical protein